jgi:hypothetical protein
MPPRHHYWTIILEGKPTAFRSHTQEELAPTLRQLQARHPDAVMKWFARGRLWESQDEERAEAFARRRAPAPREPRPRDWRPGGEHRDPRDRFKVPRDEKRRRFAEKLRRDERPAPSEGPARERPPREGPPREDRRPAFSRPPRTDRPGSVGRPAGAHGHGSRPGGGGRGPGSRPPGGRPPGARPPGARPTGPRSPGARPHGGRPHGGRPPGGRKPGGGRGGGGRGQ